MASGARTDRPQLAAVLDHLRPGDTLVVWRLDRLGRSVQDLIATVGTLRDRQIGFRSLTEGIDTTTAAGLASARRRGRVGGRPRRMTPAKLRVAVHMRGSDPPESYAVIARELGLAKTTVRRHLTEIPQPPTRPRSYRE